MIAEFLRGPEMAGRAATTVSNQKTVINNIFQYWIDSPKWRGDINPATQTKMPRGLHKGKRQPPTNEQVAVVKEHYLDPDALPAVAYLCTGERKGEMCAIQLRDIDFDKTSSTSQNDRAQGQCRCDKGLWQNPGSNQASAAAFHAKRSPTAHPKMPKDTYIIGLDTKPVSKSRYDRMWQKFWRKYGVAKPVPRTKSVVKHGKNVTVAYTDWKVPVCGHQFRHEYVCMLAMAGVPEEIAIQLVGHANAK